MRYTRNFRLGRGGLAWEIRFVFTPRSYMIGAGLDDPDPLGRPWVRRTCSVHFLCLAAVIQRAGEPDPNEVTAWMATQGPGLRP